MDPNQIHSSYTSGPSLLSLDSITGSEMCRVAALGEARNLTLQEGDCVSAGVFFTVDDICAVMGDADEDESMVGRMDESRIRFWFLLDGDRWVITGMLTLGLFVILVVAGTVGPSSFRSVMSNTNQVGIAFQAFIASLITGVTLVVTIGQLVLSQELGSLKNQRERMKATVEFRQDLTSLIGSIGLPDPAAFLRQLILTSKDRAEALEDVLAENSDDELRDQVDQFVAALIENANEVEEQLEDAEFGEFNLLRTAMNYNHSWKLYGALWLRSEYEDSLDDEERSAFDELIDVLMFFGPTREHFKALYFQWELVRLIRSILITAFPALAVAVATLLYLAPTSFPGVTFGVANIIWIVSASSAISIVPFFVLTSIVLRIATIAKRTSAIGPFILHESDRGDDIDLEN